MGALMGNDVTILTMVSEHGLQMLTGYAHECFQRRQVTGGTHIWMREPVHRGSRVSRRIFFFPKGAGGGGVLMVTRTCRVPCPLTSRPSHAETERYAEVLPVPAAFFQG